MFTFYSLSAARSSACRLTAEKQTKAAGYFSNSILPPVIACRCFRYYFSRTVFFQERRRMQREPAAAIMRRCSGMVPSPVPGAPSGLPGSSGGACCPCLPESPDGELLSRLIHLAYSVISPCTVSTSKRHARPASGSVYQPPKINPSFTGGSGSPIRLPRSTPSSGATILPPCVSNLTVS